MKVFLIAGCAAAVVLWAALSAQGLQAGDVTLSEVSLHRARPAEAFALLGRRAREADPAGEGFNVVYRPPREDVTLPRITLSLRQVSLLDAIRIISEVAGLHYRIDGNVVIITHEPTARGRIQRRTYAVNPTLMQTLHSRRPDEEEPDSFFFRR